MYGVLVFDRTQETSVFRVPSQKESEVCFDYTGRKENKYRIMFLNHFFLLYRIPKITKCPRTTVYSPNEKSWSHCIMGGYSDIKVTTIKVLTKLSKPRCTISSTEDHWWWVGCLDKVTGVLSHLLSLSRLLGSSSGKQKVQGPKTGIQKDDRPRSTVKDRLLYTCVTFSSTEQFMFSFIFMCSLMSPGLTSE